jgi:hypothetical protein
MNDRPAREPMSAKFRDAEKNPKRSTALAAHILFERWLTTSSLARRAIAAPTH